MSSAAATSAFVLPRATTSRTSSSRLVSGSIGCTGADVTEPLEESSRHRRIDQCIAVERGVHGSDELLGARSLEEEPPGSGFQRSVDVAVGVECGDDDHRNRIVDVRSGQLPCRLDAVEIGHSDVEQADVGPELPGQGDGGASVVCLTDDLDVALAVENRHQAGTDDVLVVGNEQSDGHALLAALGRTTSFPVPTSVTSGTRDARCLRDRGSVSALAGSPGLEVRRP